VVNATNRNMIDLELLTLKIKYTENQNIFTFELYYAILRNLKTWLNSGTLTLAHNTCANVNVPELSRYYNNVIACERCMLLFRIEATRYSKIVKSATKQLITRAWHRRRANRFGGGDG